ncbi:hypothetical protein GCM10023331_24600 [Algivirga pacifica]|uniref:Uncharacterized protein n=1 Tax=Algivirga pacifica TaxID=1162670 RepID=A0ABP9DBC1_9BACT
MLYVSMQKWVQENTQNTTTLSGLQTKEVKLKIKKVFSRLYQGTGSGKYQRRGNASDEAHSVIG